MSITAIKTGLYTHLTTCGPWGTQEVSTCDFGIIEQASGCAIVLHPTGEHTIEPLTFRGTGKSTGKSIHWAFEGGLYIRFTGDPRTFLSRVYTGIDNIQTTLDKDDTLGVSTSQVSLTNIRYNVNEGYRMGDQDFGVVHFTLDCYEIKQPT